MLPSILIPAPPVRGLDVTEVNGVAFDATSPRHAYVTRKCSGILNLLAQCGAIGSASLATQEYNYGSMDGVVLTVHPATGATPFRVGGFAYPNGRVVPSPASGLVQVRVPRGAEAVIRNVHAGRSDLVAALAQSAATLAWDEHAESFNSHGIVLESADLGAGAIPSTLKTLTLSAKTIGTFMVHVAPDGSMQVVGDDPEIPAELDTVDLETLDGLSSVGLRTLVSTFLEYLEEDASHQLGAPAPQRADQG
jgi:hypothetical protein